MSKALLSKKHQRRPAQALVEFSLIALVFLFLIVMIIEVARILQAYVTIQHAAREAARYAITGQFDPKYGSDPDVGWQDNRLTADPLKSIRPCWPLFSVEGYDPVNPNSIPRLSNGSVSPLLHQPYRGPRTCSVEEAAVRNMAGLIMNPNANAGEPDYYEIVIGGTVVDIDPTTGTFQRNGEEKAYATYYVPTDTVLELDESVNPPVWVNRPLSEVKPGTSRGYAGDPGKKVIVQIDYRIRMITPLLSNIVPSVKLSAYSTMTVETFGGMGLQREAVPPPPDPKPLPMTSDIKPADLHVTQLTCVVPPNPTLSDQADCTVKIRNSGDSPAPAGSTVRVYRRLESAQPSPSFDVFDNLWADTTPGIVVADLTIGAVDPHDATEATQDFSVNFPYGGGTYYVYAWADAASTTTKPSDDKDGDVVVEEDPGNPACHTNNLAVINPGISIIDSADVLIEEYLTPDSIPSELAPDPGEPITFTVTVRNDSTTSSAQGVTLTIPVIDPELSCAAPCGIPAPGVTLTATQEITHVFNITPSSNIGVRRATIRVSSTSPDDLVQVNNSVEVEIRVGGVVLDITKSVAPTTVDFNASAPSPVTYTVSVHNTSDAPASGIEVSDPLDLTKLQYVSASVTPSGTCGLVGSTVTCTNIALDRNGGPAGDTATITIQAQVIAGTPAGTITNTATVTSPQSVTKTASADLTVRGVDIVVSKTTEGNITSALQGASYTYIIQAENEGTVDAQNVRILDNLDTTSLSTTISAVADVGSYDQPSDLWTIGTLGAGTTATLRITVTVLPTATVGAVIPNEAILQAGVTPPETDPNDNRSSYPVTVASFSADLALTKTVSPTGTVMSGTPLTYTLTLTNNSPSVSVTGRSVSDTTLRDAFTDGTLRFVNAAVGPGENFSSSTGQWTGISLAPGQTATATINVIAVGTRGTVYVLPNTASTDSGTIPDPSIPGPNTAGATIQINWPAPIFINAGDPTGGGDAARRCNQVTWGSEDATLTDPVLGVRDFTWTVEPNANWTRTGGAPSPFMAGYILATQLRYFILSNDSHVQTPMGQNLFGCRTMSGGNGEVFTYRFNNLVPGTWRLYLAFADFDTAQTGQRILDVRANGTGSLQMLTGMDDFDIVRAIRNAGNNPTRHGHNVPSIHWDYHYIIRRFDVTVNAQGYLDVEFSDVGSNIEQAQINGLGIEYIQP